MTYTVRYSHILKKGFCGGPFLWRPLGSCPVCPVLSPALASVSCRKRHSQPCIAQYLYGLACDYNGRSGCVYRCFWQIPHFLAKSNTSVFTLGHYITSMHFRLHFSMPKLCHSCTSYRISGGMFVGTRVQSPHPCTGSN